MTRAADRPPSAAASDLSITFAQARAAGACAPSYRRMAAALGGVAAYGADTPIPITRVLEVLGVADTLWALEAIGEIAHLREACAWRAQELRTGEEAARA